MHRTDMIVYGRVEERFLGQDGVYRIEANLSKAPGELHALVSSVAALQKPRASVHIY